MQLGPFYININTTEVFFRTNSTYAIVVLVMAILGWLFFEYLLIYMIIYFLEEYKEDKYTEDWKWVLLAIDIPPINIQTPKAVEQLFAHLAGAYDEPSLADRFRHGYKQRWFSFEIVSIEGYIQFLIRTEEIFRDLVEAAIYAQYPEAEIIEVEDYTTELPIKFPDETYDIWASDFGLTEDDAYPIRSYMEFEHSISKDTVLKDPMGTFLESFSRIGRGEQMWFQILIQPTGNSWKEKVIKKIKDLVGDMVSTKPGKSGGGFTELIGKESGKSWNEISSQLFGGGAGESSGSESKKEDFNKLLYLTPGQKKILEAMEEKITKIGFKTKMRGIYLARKEVFRPERGVNALIGAINQFNIPSANSLAPTHTVKTDYLLKKTRNSYRKGVMMRAYKKRKMNVGGNPFIFNTEELATIWHFPMSHVKTPLLQKAEGKRAEPPSGLPVDSVSRVSYDLSEEDNEKETNKKEKEFITDAGDVAYFSDEEYG